MPSTYSTIRSNHRKLPIPAVLELLHLIHRETSDDVVLAGVVRTVTQAIDELTALRRSALEVMEDAEEIEQSSRSVPKSTDRRRLC